MNCFRYLLQHNIAAEDSLLHRQPDRALRWHILLISTGLLLASRFRREDRVKHIHFALPNHVFPSYFRNYTVYVASTSVAWKISFIHDVVSWIVGCNNHCNIKRALSQT